MLYREKYAGVAAMQRVGQGPALCPRQFRWLRRREKAAVAASWCRDVWHVDDGDASRALVQGPATGKAGALGAEVKP